MKDVKFSILDIILAIQTLKSHSENHADPDHKVGCKAALNAIYKDLKEFLDKE